ncbi:MAG: phosphoenolpyruvate-utilizing N-terminal domain-containing protein [Candidatus Limnocylindrales bacterium]
MTRHKALQVDGIAAAPGIVVGPIWRYRPPPVEAAEAAGGTKPNGHPAGGADGAALRLLAASEEAARQLEELAARVRKLGHAQESDIFEAQALMAADVALLDEATQRIMAGEDPISAVQAAAEVVAAILAALDDELLAARAADVRDVGARIARIL